MYNEQQEPELEMSDDPHDVWKIDTTNVPLAVTVSKIGKIWTIFSAFSH